MSEEQMSVQEAMDTVAGFHGQWAGSKMDKAVIRLRQELARVAAAEAVVDAAEKLAKTYWLGAAGSSGGVHECCCECDAPVEQHTDGCSTCPLRQALAALDEARKDTP